MTGRLLACSVSALTWSRTAYRQANANLVWYNIYRTVYALRLALCAPQPRAYSYCDALRSIENAAGRCMARSDAPRKRAR